MDERDEEPVVIYHSHTATEAYPSRTDISYAMEPAAHYVLVSTRQPDLDEFRAFRILDGEVTEEEVTVVPELSGLPDGCRVGGAALAARRAGPGQRAGQREQGCQQ